MVSSTAATPSGMRLAAPKWRRSSGSSISPRPAWSAWAVRRSGSSRARKRTPVSPLRTPAAMDLASATTSASSLKYTICTPWQPVCSVSKRSPPPPPPPLLPAPLSAAISAASSSWMDPPAVASAAASSIAPPPAAPLSSPYSPRRLLSSRAASRPRFAGHVASTQGRFFAAAKPPCAGRLPLPWPPPPAQRRFLPMASAARWRGRGSTWG
mmetsp:Transcript_30025/g.95961  ORF Transcript_30025/g.95961 Transcript_30025/m.95961 type:complete len:211 (+) Transcript_30025:568-1200(+)